MFRLRNSALLNPKNSHASPTPIIEGDRVYVHFGAEGTAAVSTAGEVVWKTRIQYESQHGNGGSPVLYGDVLIFNCDGFDDAFVVALDKRTGKTRWRTSRPQPWSQAYSTPLAIRVGDRDHDRQRRRVSCRSRTIRKTAKEIWRVDYPEGFSNVPRPVYGAGLVFITTGFQQPSILAVRPDGKGNVTKSHIAWTLSRGAPLTPSPLLVGDDLYVVTDAGIVSNMDAATGAVRWQHRLGACCLRVTGVLPTATSIFSTKRGERQLSTRGRCFNKWPINSLDGGALASMAVASQSFFIRTATHLYRIAK